MIDRDDRNTFSLGLGNQNPVKGIFVMIRQVVYLKYMGKVDRWTHKSVHG